MNVAELFGVLGIKVDQASFARGESALQRTHDSLAKIGAGVLAFFGLKEAKGALIDFNADVEDSKNQIAGMLALAKKTGFTDELKTANELYADLQKRAATLPGTTAEYVKMAGMITQPIIDAGLSMKDLEDLTVNAVVAAKALGVNSEVAARDIDQAIRGQFHAVDQLTGKLLGPLGYKGEEGRSKFNALSEQQRAGELKRALTQPQLTDLARAQGNTFNGIVSTFKDNLQQFFGRVGLPLFRAIGDQIRSWNAWIDKNQEKLKGFVEVLAGGLVLALDAVRGAIGYISDGVDFLREHGELAEALLVGLGVVLAVFAAQAAASWIIAFAPVVAAILIIGALYLVIKDVWQSITEGKGITATIWQWITDKIHAVVDAVKNLAKAPRDFFVDVGNAIMDFLTTVVNFAIDRLNEIIDIVEVTSNKLIDLANLIPLVNIDPANLGRLRHVDDGGIRAPSSGSSTTNVQNTYGDVNVTSNNADPVAVGNEVRKQIGEHWDGQMRDAHAATGDVRK